MRKYHLFKFVVKQGKFCLCKSNSKIKKMQPLKQEKPAKGRVRKVGERAVEIAQTITQRDKETEV